LLNGVVMMMEGSQATQLTPLIPRERQAAPERRGLIWTQIGGLTVAKISGGVPDPRDWRAFLDHLRPSVRPVILWIRGRVWIGEAGRTELAHAIGSSSLSLVVDDDLGRGLATALRWLGVEVNSYSYSEIDQLETNLELPDGIGDRLLAQVL
jgi:hypothetical protein